MDTRTDSDYVAVRRMVLERLTEIGFDAAQVVRLLDADADWRRAQQLIEAGCSPELVLRILL